MKMRYANAIAPLLIGGTCIAIAPAKNYGPTSDHCVEEDGSSCPVDEKSTKNSSDNIGTSPVPERFQRAKTGKLPEASMVKKVYEEGDDDDDDDGDDDGDDDDGDDDDGESLPNGQCGVFLAPSTLPHAGLGLFSGSAIPFNHSVNEYIGGTFPGFDDDEHPPLWTDLFIPIADEYKALPYRGQQRFPSWLQYIWPESPGALSYSTEIFPPVPHELCDFDLGFNHADGIKFFADDMTDKLSKMKPNHRPKERVSAFAPGLASLANSDGRLSNMDRIFANSRVDFNGQVAPWHPGAGAFTPHHGIEFSVSKKGGVYAGMELVSNIMMYFSVAILLSGRNASLTRFSAPPCPSTVCLRVMTTNT